MEQRMVARVVIIVGDHGVEDHTAKQLTAVLVGLGRPAPQLIGQKQVRPALPTRVAIFRVEHSQAGYQPVVGICLGIWISFAVEALKHERVLRANTFQACAAHTQPSCTGEFEGRELDSLVVDPPNVVGIYKQCRNLVSANRYRR